MPELKPSSAYRTGTIVFCVVLFIGAVFTQFWLKLKSEEEERFVSDHKRVGCVVAYKRTYKGRKQYEYQCEDGLDRLAPEFLPGRIVLFVSKDGANIWLDREPTLQWANFSHQRRQGIFGMVVAGACFLMVVRRIRYEYRLRIARSATRHRGKLRLPSIQVHEPKTPNYKMPRLLVTEDGKHIEMVVTMDELSTIEAGKPIDYFERSGRYYGSEYFADFEFPAEQSRS